jgi:RHS repeat-associated protein
MFEGMIPSQYYKPSWIADPGTKSTLQADDTWLYAWGDGTYYVMDSYDLNQSDYSPANVNGGFMTLTLRNGVDLVIDATNGTLHQAVDMNGNTLTFTERGITHSSGKGVVFERDYQDRITSITGPDGKKVTYTYDSKGDLVAVTDTSNATVQFTYLTDPKAPEHYLDTVIDPLGRSAAKTEFDEQGRIKKVIDAEGNITEYSFDLGSNTQRITDALGNTRTLYTDSRGNVVKEISAEGHIILRSFDSNGKVLSVTQVIEHNGAEINLTYTYTYDSDGNITSEKDFFGNVTSYTYNKYGQQTSMTIDGVTVYTNYDNETGLIRSKSDIYGAISSFRYDDRGNMTVMYNCNGVALFEYTFNKYGETTSVRSATGRVMYYEYDNNGDRILSWYSENGITILDKMEYDDMRRQTSQVRYKMPSNISVHSQNIEAYVVYRILTEFNDAGEIIRLVDEKGMETQYIYNARGNVTEVRTQVKDTDGSIRWSIKRSVYDAVGQVVAVTDAFIEGSNVNEIRGTICGYDKDGRLIKTEYVLGLNIQITSNGQSFIKSVYQILSTTTSTYNSAGWLLSKTDTNGIETRYLYNSFGSNTQIIEILLDGSVRTTEKIYDNKGQGYFYIDSHIDGVDVNLTGTKVVYDNAGRLVRTERYSGCKIQINSDGSIVLLDAGKMISYTETNYDKNGNISSQRDSLGNITTYKYDSLNREMMVIQPNGNITETIYDSLGKIEMVRVSFGGVVRETRYEYDIYGNIIKIINPDRTEISATYDEKGQKTSETNQVGETRYFFYDEYGLVTSVIMPDGSKYEYEYDVEGNQTLIRDPNGHETRFTYDSAGRMLSRTLPLGFGSDGIRGTADDIQGINSDGTLSHTEYFTYDSIGRLVKHISFEGVVTTISYDNNDRIIGKFLYSTKSDYENNQIAESWSFEYDSVGRETKVTRNNVTTETVYDNKGRILSVKTTEGTSTSTIYYEYDSSGRQTAVTLDSGERTEYTYDTFGRLKTIKADDIITEYYYDALGNLLKSIESNGNVTLYQYDAMNRLIRLTNFVDVNQNGVMDQGEGISDFNYGLDEVGHKIFAHEKFWTDFNNDDIIDEITNTIYWKYDKLGRLIEEIFDHYDDEFDQTTNWTYDLVGNRLSQITDKGNDGTIDSTTSYQYDANDRLLSEVENIGVNEKTTNYGYNSTQQISKNVVQNGKLVSDVVFGYDASGRMNSVKTTTYKEDGETISGWEVVSYIYDTNGNRITAIHEIFDEQGNITSKTSVTYIVDQQNITGYTQVVKQIEKDLLSDSEKITTYVIGHQRISQTVEINGEKTAHKFAFDGHGSTRAMVNSLGKIAENYSFDAFGNALGFNAKQAITEFLYSGEQFDSKIGQQYLRARYYDPATGRFNRLDPFFGNLNDPQSLHKYTYAHNDPVNGTDPTGRSIAMSVGIGSALGSNMQGNSSRANISVGYSLKTKVQFLQKALDIFDKVMDAVDAGQEILDLVTMGPAFLLEFADFYKKAPQEFMDKIVGFTLGAIDLYVKDTLNLPEPVVKRFNDMINAGKNDVALSLLGEAVGTIGTNLLARVIGFKEVYIRLMHTGIDAIYLSPGVIGDFGSVFVIAESKGNSAILHNTVRKGTQMSSKWIDASIRQIVDKNLNELDYKDLEKMNESDACIMIALLVKLDLRTIGTEKPAFHFGLQVYQGYKLVWENAINPNHGKLLKKWGEPFGHDM